ncbi:MAG TPA: AAA family ATPase [Chloroflexota bacterium]
MWSALPARPWWQARRCEATLRGVPMGELSDGKVTFLFTDVEGNLLRRGHQLEATGAAPRRLDTALRTRETRPGDLPLQPTALLGRDREVAAALERLLRPEVRLLTLTGPGGTGKTRLALEVAVELVNQFADGVVLVPLAALSDPELVPATIAQTLGLREVSGRSLLEGVAGFLRDKQLLLLLDNFEQILPAAPAVAEFLAACPRLKVLVTSRAPLELSGEHEQVVPPLPLPDLAHLPPPEALLGYGAVALFVQRAAALKPEFALTEDNAPAVAAICCRLDGLPLALELAAARVRLLPPAALLARLEHRLALLIAGAADLPARQRTLRATLTWSYDLLDPAQQALFRRLGVFVGGCALEAAEAVAHAAGPLGIDLLEGLDALVRHSLLLQEEADGEPRFAMLETVREFALEQLALAGEAEATRAAQVEALLQRLDGDLGPEQWGPELRIPQLERERENLGLALGWCAEHGDVERGLRLASRSTGLWWQAGPRTEGLSWLRQFLERAPPGLPDWLHLRALASAGWLAGWLGDLAAARAYLVEGLALAEAIGDKRTVVTFVYGAVGVALQDGDLAAAQSAAERMLAQARRIGSIPDQGRALMQRGTVAHLRGNVAGAAAAYRETLALPDLASPQYALRNLGYLTLEGGQPEEAVARFREALEDTWSRRLDSAVLENLNAFAALARARGQWERAARLLGAADAGLERLGGVLPEPIGRRERERTLAAVQAHLSEPAYAAAYAAGRELSLEQAVQEALGE